MSNKKNPALARQRRLRNQRKPKTKCKLPKSGETECLSRYGFILDRYTREHLEFIDRQILASYPK